MKELEPTSGTIIVNDQNLGKMKRRKVPKYRRGVGVVFQDFRLLKDRNVYENVAFAQRVIERPNRVIKKRVPEILTLVGLAEKYKSFPRELSGGEQQRVALAVHWSTVRIFFWQMNLPVIWIRRIHWRL